MNNVVFVPYPFAVLGTYRYHIGPKQNVKSHSLPKGLNPSPLYQSKEHPQLSISPYSYLRRLTKINYITACNKRLLYSILVLVPIGTTIRNSAHIACGRIQTASEAPNESKSPPAYVHPLALPVGRAWWLPQPDPWAPWRICAVHQ